MQSIAGQISMPKKEPRENQRRDSLSGVRQGNYHRTCQAHQQFFLKKYSFIDHILPSDEDYNSQEQECFIGT